MIMSNIKWAGIFLFISLLSFNGFSQEVSRCIASPEPVTIQQADGSLITIIGKGNALVNYTESVDGYPLIVNKDGNFEYAIPDQQLGLIASGIKANDPSKRTLDETDFLVNKKSELLISENRILDYVKAKNDAHAQFKQLPDKNADPVDNKLVATFPNSGKRNVLVILIQYPDLKAKYSLENFQDMMTKPGHAGYGSFKDYYAENSFGKLDLNIDVFGWYTAKNDYKYYGNSKGNAQATYLIAEAIDSAYKSGVDFSKYDNDGDGNVDGILVVHSGPGAEEGSQSQYIWSHRFNLGGSTRKYNNVKISDYVINPETRGGINGRMVGIGVYCHEFGHLLGLPDLYDINYSYEGVGNWSLMGGGGWLNSEHTPACFDAWSKTYLKWITPVEINKEGFYTLQPSTRDSTIYKCTSPVPHEYFLIENRQFMGFDSKLNGRGLAIWRINDSIVDRTIYWNTTNASKFYQGVKLMEADGREDLINKKNRGDYGDLFPGSSFNYTFDDDTKPNARTLNGNKSNIIIFNIKQLADSSIEFGFGSLPYASITAPTSVCSNTPVNLKNNSKFASNYLWEFGDGNSDTTFNPEYTYTQPGTYYVKLQVTTDKGVTSVDSVKILVTKRAQTDISVEVSGRDVTIHNRTKDATGYSWYWGDGKLGYVKDTLITRTYPKLGTYELKVIAYGAAGCNDTFVQKIFITQNHTSIDHQSENVLQNISVYPNPTTETVNIKFDAPEAVQVDFKILNLLGAEVATPQRINLPAGSHTINRNLPTDLAKGMYILQLKANDYIYHVSVLKN